MCRWQLHERLAIHTHGITLLGVFSDVQSSASYNNGTLYQSSSFSINSLSWILRLEVVKVYDENGDTVGRSLLYQLVLCKSGTYSKPNQVSARFVAISGPIIEANADIHTHLFKLSDKEPESPYYELYLANSEECNRLLSSQTINLRLIISFISFNTS